MNYFRIGDIVTRRSYGEDISFVIVGIMKTKEKKIIYNLRGILYRLEADSRGEDLIMQHRKLAYYEARKSITESKERVFKDFVHRISSRVSKKTGRILHIDSSREFFNTCMNYYKEAGLIAVGRVAKESEQPRMIRALLSQYRSDVLVVTGHDSYKKGLSYSTSLDNYKNSKYFIESVKEARRIEPTFDRLCIFAGACQSYYEAIMGAGANFASSPGRIMINALDPATVSSKIALTDENIIVSPKEVVKATVSGTQGIGGIGTRGHMKVIA